MSEELVKFLKKSGTVDILCSVPDSGIGFGELVDSVRISRGTLHKRLNEGMNPNSETEFTGLWSRHLGKREDGKSAYILTPHGRRLRQAMSHHGMPALLSEIIAKTQEFERQKTNIIDAVEEHGVVNLDEVYADDGD